MKYNPCFHPLSGGEDLIDIPPEILAQMSTEQRTSYRLVAAVKAGCLPESLQYLKCGELSHARWLTTGQRLVFLWTRHHGLSKKNARLLEQLARFFINYYFKLYFDIKVRHRIIDAPRHILTSLRLLRSEPKAISDIISPYIQSGAWHAHSENLLLCLLASSDAEERAFAVEKILTCRGEQEYGDNSVRVRTNPKLYFNALKLIDLICWKETKVEEPIFTTGLSENEIVQLKVSPLSVPNFSCHTQSTERCVKLTTEAAAAVAGQTARHQYIKARNLHKQILPKFKTKNDILKTF